MAKEKFNRRSKVDPERTRLRTVIRNRSEVSAPPDAVFLGTTAGALYLMALMGERY